MQKGIQGHVIHQILTDMKVNKFRKQSSVPPNWLRDHGKTTFLADNVV